MAGILVHAGLTVPAETGQWHNPISPFEVPVRPPRKMRSQRWGLYPLTASRNKMVPASFVNEQTST